MEWEKIGKNKYPEIILSDCQVDKIQIRENNIKLDFLKDGFLIKNSKDNQYYHTGNAQLVIEKCDVDDISIKIIKKNKTKDEKYIDVIQNIENKEFIGKVNLKKWKFVVVEEYYSELGAWFIGRIREGEKKFWCYIKVNFDNLIYLWNDIKDDYPVN